MAKGAKGRNGSHASNTPGSVVSACVTTYRETDRQMGRQADITVRTNRTDRLTDKQQGWRAGRQTIVQLAHGLGDKEREWKSMVRQQGQMGQGQKEDGRQARPQCMGMSHIYCMGAGLSASQRPDDSEATLITGSSPESATCIIVT